MPGNCKGNAERLKNALSDFGNELPKNGGKSPKKTETPKDNLIDKKDGLINSTEEEKANPPKRAGGGGGVRAEKGEKKPFYKEAPKSVALDFCTLDLAEAKQKALSAEKGLKIAIIDLYERFFKNNAAFKADGASVVADFEEYLQAALITAALGGENKNERAAEFVYGVLPEADCFAGLNVCDEQSLFNRLKTKTEKLPLAVLMAAGADLSFNTDYFKRVLEGISGLIKACACAFGFEIFNEEKITRDLMAFAKKQGVRL